ncbi:MAG: hypothetical protein WC914_11285 [Proteiniphilum sp.]
MEDYNTTPPPVPPTPGSSNQGLPPHEPWQEPPVESPPVRDGEDDIPPLKPNNWLWASILATLFCCIFFQDVDSARGRGRIGIHRVLVVDVDYR